MSFSKETIDNVWSEAESAATLSSATYKKDPYRNMIERNRYGENASAGWAIDHIIPESYGGSDHISNLQAMNFQKNQELGDRLNKKTRYGLMSPVGTGISEGVFIGGKKRSLDYLRKAGMIKKSE